MGMDVRATLAPWLVGGLLAASLYAWIRMVTSRFRWPVIPWQSRRPVPWGSFELVVSLALFSVAFAIPLDGSNDSDRPAPPLERPRTGFLDGQEKNPPAIGDSPAMVQHPAQADTLSSSDIRWRRRLVYDVMARLIWCALTIILVKLSSGARSRDFGWASFSFRDVTTGLTLFVLAAPGIYGLQAVLHRFWDKQHPLIELLQRSDDLVLWLLAGISVIVVAPVVEEFAFRALFQSWLEKICHVHLAEAGGFAVSHGVFGEPSVDRIPGRRRLLIPPLLSAAVFAVLHAGQGPAWIPLFFFGLILGFLYLRTHRLLSCITLHAALNGYSFLLLILVTPSGK